MLRTPGNLPLDFYEPPEKVVSAIRSNVFYLRDQNQGQMSRLFIACITRNQVSGAQLPNDVRIVLNK